MVDWVFSNLDPCFKEAVTRFSTIILVYFNLVQSQIVGEQKIDLLAEVHCNGQQQGTIYYEPKHIQRGPCWFQHNIEIKQNKKNDGSVKELDQGKTLMRVLFRQV